MSKASKQGRYREKMQGAPRKTQVNRWCKSCLSPHCHCGVNTKDHFIPTDRQLEEWYGAEWVP